MKNKYLIKDLPRDLYLKIVINNSLPKLFFQTCFIKFSLLNDKTSYLNKLFLKIFLTIFILKLKGTSTALQLKNSSLNYNYSFFFSMLPITVSY